MQETGLIKSSPENILLSEDLFWQFSQSAERLTPDLCPEALSAGVEGQRLLWPATSFFCIVGAQF